MCEPEEYDDTILEDIPCDQCGERKTCILDSDPSLSASMRRRVGISWWCLECYSSKEELRGGEE